MEILRESCDIQNPTKPERKGEDAKASRILPDLAGAARKGCLRFSSAIALGRGSSRDDAAHRYAGQGSARGAQAPAGRSRPAVRLQGPADRFGHRDRRAARRIDAGELRASLVAVHSVGERAELAIRAHGIILDRARRRSGLTRFVGTTPGFCAGWTRPASVSGSGWGSANGSCLWSASSMMWGIGQGRSLRMAYTRGWLDGMLSELVVTEGNEYA